MKKFILGFMLIGLVGCSDDNINYKQKISDLRESNDTLQSKLNSCEAKLEYSGYNKTENVSSEPEAPPEKTCYEESYQQLYQNNKKVDTCKFDDVTETACGIRADNCESGYAYSCLKDVSYKTITKEICD